jgi:hypothetical protein
MEPETPELFVGYEAAAKYLGLKRNTLSSYVARGIGPVVADRKVEGQYVLPVFRQSDLDEWRKDRPGQGARTDLTAAGEDEPADAELAEASTS